MTTRWVIRKAHSRRLISGRIISIRENWACYEADDGEVRQRYRHSCPKCGVQILSVHMPAGGWVHYEGAKGLTRVKHPCLHQGEDMSRARDRRTLDLFR